MATRFSELLSKFREDQGLSQRGLVERLHGEGYEKYQVAAISKWETGRAKPPTDVVEVLEDILGISPGVLLQAAEYYQAANQRRAEAEREQQGRQGNVQALAARMKEELTGLAMVEKVVVPRISSITEPGLYDLWLEGKSGTVCFKYERKSDGQVVIHCPVEHEPGFAFLSKLLREAGVWQDYGEWQEMARRLVLRIGDRTARGRNRDYPRPPSVPGREVPTQDLRVQLNRLAVRLEQGIDAALAGR